MWQFFFFFLLVCCFWLMDSFAKAMRHNALASVLGANLAITTR